MSYKQLNNYTGWLVFLIATIVYFMTIEDTVSLWDCGEYITAAYKLEVGHPPGAPLFMLLGRLFSFFAEKDMVAVWINRMSALSSSATILFMYWSITMLTRKIAFREGRQISKSQTIAILGSAFVGSMAYTFSDSFWFSAVEGEVYAMSSFFTAIIFWAMLKWDEEMDAIKHGEIENSHLPLRWMILIMFMFGLAIGVHLLGLLVVPSIGFVIYFNRWKDFSWKGFFLTGVISVFVLGFVQEGVIPGTIWMASAFEVSFVNNFGFSFYSGAIFFFILLILAFVFLLRWAQRKSRPVLHAVTLGFILFLIGYGSFATIVIRSNANTPLDENDPENLVTLYSYLKREQYGSWPILYGPYWNSDYPRTSTGEVDNSGFKDGSRFYARRWVVSNMGMDIKGFRNEAAARKFAKDKGPGHEVVEKYFCSNEEYRKNIEPVYAQNTFLPRMYWSADAAKTEKYKEWSGYNLRETEEGDEKGVDGQRIPSFGENMRYMFHYQVNWMYWRYFMWNFAGRQNDIQGHGDEMRGNWVSGIPIIDNYRLGDQGELPYFTTQNQSYNRFFLLPLILGIIGMVFHFYRAPKDAFVVLLTCIFTGLAIVLYLNQKPMEPRERDYAYAASFYAFAMWIGISVYALYEAFKSFKAKENIGLMIVSGAGLVICLFFDLIFGGGLAATMTWLIIALVGSGLILLFNVIGKSLKNESMGAFLAIGITAIAPLLMAVQGWDDHDRSEKSSARDLAYNYLQSCTKNSILFTNGDNDTFPLWYMQEVEEVRTDVRVCNLSLMQTDWYTEQMMMKAYDSDPLPISFRDDQIMMYAGNTDVVYFFSLYEMVNAGVPQAALDQIIDAKIKANKAEFSKAFDAFKNGTAQLVSTLKGNSPEISARIQQIQGEFSKTYEQVKGADVRNLINYCLEIFSAYSNGLLTADRNALQQLQQTLTTWDTNWDYLPIDQAMKFVRNDENLINYNRRKMRVFPSKGFIVPVNKDNIVKSGLVEKKDLGRIANEIRFKIDKQAIQREQVMMLDIMANNDWKRNIYFSSPVGSDVSYALYVSGHIKQNGMAYELNPTPENDLLAKDKMYNNILNVYSYGKMNQKGVLSDYYTRRHTSQFRDHFSRLGEAYLRLAYQEEMNEDNFGRQIPLIRSSGNNRLADSLQNVIKGADSRIADYKKKAAALIHHSISVMPPDFVIDYGEPNATREKYDSGNGLTFPKYTDGVLHDYVDILYRAGDKAGAELLGNKVADELESILNFFRNNHGSTAGLNSKDFVSAMHNYMSLAASAAGEDGNPKGALNKRTMAYITRMINVDLPRIYSELKNDAIDAGDRITGGKTGAKGRRYLDFRDHTQAVAMEFGFVKKPVAPPTNGGAGGLSPEEIQKMIQMQQQQ